MLADDRIVYVDPKVNYLFMGSIYDMGSKQNLTEDRLTRYVKVNITLEVDPTKADAMTKLMTGPDKAVFRNWLITYLSDKQLQDVKGANAMNRLRREIQDGFNAILAERGDLKVERVLFEDFNVQ